MADVAASSGGHPPRVVTLGLCPRAAPLIGLVVPIRSSSRDGPGRRHVRASPPTNREPTSALPPWVTQFGVTGGQTGSKQATIPGSTLRESGGARRCESRKIDRFYRGTRTAHPDWPRSALVRSHSVGHRRRRCCTHPRGRAPTGAVKLPPNGSTRRLGTVDRHRPDALFGGPPGPDERRTGCPELGIPADPDTRGGPRPRRRGPVVVRPPGLRRRGPGPGAGSLRVGAHGRAGLRARRQLRQLRERPVAR